MTKILDSAALPHLAEVLKEIGEGEFILTVKNGCKIAEVKPLEEKVEATRKERVLGLSRGAVTYIADDFDAELPDSFWLGEE